MSGHKDWHDRNVAERLVFSSYTTAPADIGGRDITRPYAIVVQSGYEVPTDLDKGSKDALWFEGDVGNGRIVWDGFSIVALYEIIYECFGFKPGQTKGKISVAARADGRFIPDPRSMVVLRHRPVKPKNLGIRSYKNHVLDLYTWASMFKKAGFGADGGTETFSIYDDLVKYDRKYGTVGPISEDSIHKTSSRPPATSSGPKIIQGLRKGPTGSTWDDVRVVERSYADNTLEAVARNSPHPDKLSGGVPSSLFEMSVPSNRDPKTGLIHNLEANLQEDYAKTIGKSSPVRRRAEPGESVAAETREAAKSGQSFIARIMASRRRF